MRSSLFILPLILVACGTPQELCIRQATAELRAVTAQRETVEANLARGYGYEIYEVTHREWELCGVQPAPGSGSEPRYCLEEVTDRFKRRVAIDPLGEKQRLAGLRARETVLKRQAADAIGACQRDFPEES